MHQRIGERGEERALHGEALPPLHRCVEQTLRRQVRLRLDGVLERAVERAEAGKIALGIGRRPAVQHGHRRDRPASIPAGGQAERRPQLVGPRFHELAIALGQLCRPLDRVDDRAMGHRPLEGMQEELERRHDPEVRAGSAHAPEELGMLVLARPHDLAVGGDELDREQVVDRQAELALQPAHPAAERQAGHSRVGDDTDRADEPVRLRRVVELGEQRAAAHAGGPPLRIDRGATHPREVDHDAVVAGREAGDAVAAAPNGDDELLLTGETERRDDVVGARRPHDHRRPTVDHAVPDRARRVVVRVAGAHDLARECVRQLSSPRGSVTLV